jgi:hypothetical protein
MKVPPHWPKEGVNLVAFSGFQWRKGQLIWSRTICQIARRKTQTQASKRRPLCFRAIDRVGAMTTVLGKLAKV